MAALRAMLAACRLWVSAVGAWYLAGRRGWLRGGRGGAGSAGVWVAGWPCLWPARATAPGACRAALAGRLTASSGVIKAAAATDAANAR
jgi:hypothetical protein